jgi:gluconolactonase
MKKAAPVSELHANSTVDGGRILSRRCVLCAIAVAIPVALKPKLVLAGWEPNERYPDPAVKVLDPTFSKYRLTLASIERLASGMRFTEGPVWIGDARCLLWSDLPSDRIMRWDERDGSVSVFREPSNYANGNTRDRQGRLLTCEQDSRRVTRTEHDGTITVLIDRFEGKRLNSPNDIVVKSDDSIWFTDPLYGINGNYEGHFAEQELPTNVYRLDPNSGRATVVAGDIRPNGLCFSPDEKRMYLVDYKLRGIRVYDLTSDGRRLTNGRAFVKCEDSVTPDGFRCDVDGNLWCGWAGGEGLDGVVVFNSAGQLIGRIDLPERCANVCFGGLKRNRLFMAASHSVYALYVGTQGVAGG